MVRRVVLVAALLGLVASACGGVEEVEDVLGSRPPPTPTATPTATPQASPSVEPTSSPTTGAEPAIVVERPEPGDEVRSPVRISGSADVFEATVSIRVLDADGQELASTFTTAECGSGCRGDYSAEVFFFVTARQTGTIEVFEASAQDGSVLNLVQVPVVLVPGR